MATQACMTQRQIERTPNPGSRPVRYRPAGWDMLMQLRKRHGKQDPTKGEMVHSPWPCTNGATRSSWARPCNRRSPAGPPRTNAGTCRRPDMPEAAQGIQG